MSATTVSITNHLGKSMLDEIQLSPDARKIYDSPAFQTLRARRGRLSVVLTVLMLAVYYGFILLIAFSPKTLAIKISDGAMTLGFPLGIGVILSAIVLTGIYVRRANKEFDQLTRQAVASVK